MEHSLAVLTLNLSRLSARVPYKVFVIFLLMDLHGLHGVLHLTAFVALDHCHVFVPWLCIAASLPFFLGHWEMPITIVLAERIKYVVVTFATSGGFRKFDFDLDVATQSFGFDLLLDHHAWFYLDSLL